MEIGKVAAEPDPFGIETAAGAEEVEVRLTFVGSGSTVRTGVEEVEARLTLVGCGSKPGGGAVEVWKRDTPVAMPAGKGSKRHTPKDWSCCHGHWSHPQTSCGKNPRQGRDIGKYHRGCRHGCCRFARQRGIPQLVKESSEIILEFWRTGQHYPHAGTGHLLKGVLHDGG